MPVLLRIPRYRRIAFEGSGYGIECDGDTVLLKASHNPPDGSPRAIIELRLGRRIAYAQLGGKLQQVSDQL